jgi:hypothetical protein
LLNILNQDKKSKFIFAIEHNSSVISKLRSYKGFIDKSKVEGGLFLEKEILVSNKESRFAFIGALSNLNFTYLTKFIFDSHYCFLISSENDYINEVNLEELASFFPLRGTTHINFLKAMIELCRKGDFIYRIGGDDGEEYWSLQVMKEKGSVSK